MLAGIDPVAIGLVTSLARPGGMITGLAGFLVDLAGKYLELLITAAPKVKRVGFLADTGNPNHAELLSVGRRAARNSRWKRALPTSRAPKISTRPYRGWQKRRFKASSYCRVEHCLPSGRAL